MIYKVPNLDDPRLAKAYVFAYAAHAAVGQRRKYSDEPYIVHPADCVATLQSLPKSSNITMAMLIAMMLHDTIEDTRWFETRDGRRLKNPHEHVSKGFEIVMKEGITLDQVRTEFSFGDAAFGAEVCRILSGLTDVSMPWDGNRAMRRAIDLNHTAEQAADVHTCKLADILSNSPSIIEHDPGFARRWMSEKDDLLPILKDGDQILFERVELIVSEYKNRKHNQ